MGDGVSVPPFRQHRDGHNTADVCAELARLANSIHHLSQQLLVGDVIRRARIAGSLNLLPLEPIDLIGGHGAEVVIQPFALFKLLAVYEQCIRARQRIAGGLVEVPEQGEASVLQFRGAVLKLAMET